MKKSIVNIEGVKVLNKQQQNKIKAGYDCCDVAGGVNSSLLGSILGWTCGCEQQ